MKKKSKIYSSPTMEVIMFNTHNIMYASKTQGGCSCGCETADKPHSGCWNCPDCNHENQGNHECYPEVKAVGYSVWDDEL